MMNGPEGLKGFGEIGQNDGSPITPGHQLGVDAEDRPPDPDAFRVRGYRPPRSDDMEEEFNDQVATWETEEGIQPPEDL